MPIYDFECQVCGLRFESLAPSGEQYAECPNCQTDECVSRFGVPLPSPHIWKGSSSGAEPKKSRK